MNNLDLYARKIMGNPPDQLPGIHFFRIINSQIFLVVSSSFRLILSSLSTQLNIMFLASSTNLSFAYSDPAQRLQYISEIRDNMDIVQTNDYGQFLKFLFPVFYNTLRQGLPQLVDGPEQKSRNILLEILNRLPNNELLKYVTIFWYSIAELTQLCTGHLHLICSS